MASIVGDIMRHGPHHSAQKSTRTGASEFKTSLSQPASVNVSVFAPAIYLLSLPLSIDVVTGKKIQLAEAAGTSPHTRPPKPSRRSLSACLPASCQPTSHDTYRPLAPCAQPLRVHRQNSRET